MNLKPVPNPAPYIFSILALGEVQDRLAEQARVERADGVRMLAARSHELSIAELIEARAIAQEHGYTVAEAADIVRRSRRP